MGLDEKQDSGPVFRVTLSPGEDGYGDSSKPKPERLA